LFSLLFRLAPEREDYLVAELSEYGTTGITEEDGGLRAFFDASSDSRWLLNRFAEFAPEVREEAPTDWAQATRDAWPAQMVGQRFYLVPPWRRDEPTPPGRVRLEVSPGMACGTGRHPATQLCLQAIERYVHPGNRVLDVGTGSGILARAAALMGAERVIACDIDPDALRVARECRDSPPLFAGSIDAVCSRWADVIMANIDSATIELLLPELARVRKPDSILILSGFPAGEVPEGFQPKEILQQGEWLCLID
jgi:ribosomal protein L11 methyltransferase